MEELENYSESSINSVNPEIQKSSIGYCNEFVGYLNSLQRSGGGNENALAEFQSCNAHFSKIFVSHPLVNIIYEELNNPQGNHIILTGHAGDGKSTVALEVFKRLKGIPIDEPLKNPMNLREDINNVSILKDLSERDRSNDFKMIDEIILNVHRFLLISNTGTLMDLIKANSEKFGKDKISLESDVLKSISTISGEGELNFGKVKFRVFNLAKLDNLGLAKIIFKKMLSIENWKICLNTSCQNNCPIKFNVDIIHKKEELVLDRIFLAYRRMYEYGTRLTLRQFTEHLSYIITSGIEEHEIRERNKSGYKYKMCTNLFLNKFFGDNGASMDSNALNMKAIQEIRKQGFGHRPNTMWNHKLWLSDSEEVINFGVKEIESEFERLREAGSVILSQEGVNPNQARLQIGRILYFLYDFSENEKDFLTQYLNSPTLLMWQAWQHPNYFIGLNEKRLLEQKIFHVIQEHFTGVRLPEGSSQQDQRLYITLSRRRNEIRQSAQIVLAQVDWNDATCLELIEYRNITGDIRYDLRLTGRNQIKGVDLELRIPFLDYMMLRHFGELAEVIHASYLERLDCYKAKFQQSAQEEKEKRIMLVRLRTDNSFKRQYYSIINNKLEVTND